ncbi:hypothetical protein BDV40DRAFT_276412 [Aspergillus tamarii]|uniref:Uncharacterized protein n=1 Tax=Aspergillus tamarii TaxID=41984 RepID=A0A5N6UJF5_ASPTM|nr:hypothetical protein BDV40DRAFT_276412 [Aspergillus tamarii]
MQKGGYLIPALGLIVQPGTAMSLLGIWGDHFHTPLALYRLDPRKACASLPTKVEKLIRGTIKVDY